MAIDRTDTLKTATRLSAAVNLGVPIERETHFDADKTRSAYADLAREHGCLVT